jgi:hypothetical protein
MQLPTLPPILHTIGEKHIDKLSFPNPQRSLFLSRLSLFWLLGSEEEMGQKESKVVEHGSGGCCPVGAIDSTFFDESYECQGEHIHCNGLTA